MLLNFQIFGHSLDSLYFLLLISHLVVLYLKNIFYMI